MKRASCVGITGALVASVGVLVAALPAAGAGPATFRGVVLAKNARLQAIAVAATNGVVRTVRVQAVRERLGARVDVRATPLRDGTFRATRISSSGRAHRAIIRGAVVVRQLRGRLLVSAGKSVFAIRWARRTSASGGGSALKSGTRIDATVEITPAGELDVASINTVEGSSATGSSGPTGPTGATGASGPTGDDQGENEDGSGTSSDTGNSGPGSEDGGGND